MSQIVTVKYRTQKIYCNCCGHKLEKPEVSHEREFDFSKNSCLEWLEQEHWRTEAEYPDELLDIIQEFVYETIHFFATSSDSKLLIDSSELEKVKKFILEEIVA